MKHALNLYGHSVFFFKAEDGIRDYKVTGVQTCALPISVEPLVHAPEAVQSARIGGIGVVDDTVLEHERAHARSLAGVRGRVGSGHGRVVADRRPRHAAGHPLVAAYLPRRLAPVVVFDASLALLFLGE